MNVICNKSKKNLHEFTAQKSLHSAHSHKETDWLPQTQSLQIPGKKNQNHTCGNDRDHVNEWGSYLALLLPQSFGSDVDFGA